MPAKILFISHNASRSGAPLLLLEMAKYFSSKKDFEVDVLCIDGGELKSEFNNLKLNHFAVANETPSFFARWKTRHRIQSFLDKEYDLIYLNTACSCKYFNDQPFKSKKVILHLHELSSGIDLCGIDELFQALRKIDYVICVSQIVEENLLKLSGSLSIQINTVVINGFLRTGIKQTQNLLSDKINFAIVGSATKIKGMDLLPQVASALLDNKIIHKSLSLSWYGANENWDLTRKTKEIIANSKANDFCKIYPIFTNINKVWSKVNVLILLSREDSYPLSVIEAAYCGIPTICFDRNNGIYQFIELHGGGKVVPYMDTEAIAEAITNYVNNSKLIIEDGRRAQQIFSKFSALNQIEKIEKLCRKLLS